MKIFEKIKYYFLVAKTVVDYKLNIKSIDKMNKSIDEYYKVLGSCEKVKEQEIEILFLRKEFGFFINYLNNITLDDINRYYDEERIVSDKGLSYKSRIINNYQLYIQRLRKLNEYIEKKPKTNLYLN